MRNEKLGMVAGERIELLSSGKSQNPRVLFYMLADFCKPLTTYFI